MNGIRVAKKFSDEGLVLKMSKALNGLDMKISGNYEDDGLWGRMGKRFEDTKNPKRAERKEVAKESPRTGEGEQVPLDSSSKTSSK